MIKPYICHADADFDNKNVCSKAIDSSEQNLNNANAWSLSFSIFFSFGDSKWVEEEKKASCHIYFHSQTHLFLFIFQAIFPSFRFERSHTLTHQQQQKNIYR